ncbi:MAG TPA: methionine ABC transporter ATP-binding protein [Treponema sp.]|nr:methionine ABC transporter ATP-binding protein [Treponema sp.]
MIEIQNISKTFKLKKQTVRAVNDVSLDIHDGEIFGIIGYSGAGKSTLVRCINLLERPDRGSVVVGGKEMTALSEKELRKERRNIGMIFQHFNLFPSRTVAENVAFPLKYRKISKEDIGRKVTSLLSLVELSDKTDAYPSQLSGGQQQRAAITRALATDPKVLLCDEATSALDPQTTHSILSLLKNLNAKLGLTVVIITHEMNVIKEICDRVAVMENGRIVEQNDVFSIFASPQQPITRKFIDSTSVLYKIHELIEENSGVTKLKDNEKILKLQYLEKNASEALISAVSRKFSVDCNIIFGSIEIIGNAPLGGTVVIISGTEQDIQGAIAWLREKNIQVEVLKDGKNN